MRKRGSFIADQRGAVAFEMTMVWLLLILFLLLPLADVAIAGFQYISAWQALRAFGQSIQYYPPPDFTNTSGWYADPKVVAAANADTRFPITNIQFFCGSAACSTGNNTAPLKYYSYQTTVTLSPILLTLALCGNRNPCSLALTHSERFQ
jgi:hypothetical protein